MQTYNPRSSLTTLTFWKNGVFMAAVDAAICFFIPYYATTTNGQRDVNDVFSVGKTVFVALLGTVTLEVGPVLQTLLKIWVPHGSIRLSTLSLVSIPPWQASLHSVNLVLGSQHAVMGLS